MSSVEQAKPRLLIFYSPRDGEARRLDGFLAQVLQRRHNHQTFTISRIDATARPDLIEHFRVTETPAVYVIDARKVAGRAIRPRSCEELRELMRPWLR